MDEESQRTIAVWSLYFLSFVFLGFFLHMQGGQLTIELVGVYWFPAVILTVIGVIPPPWEPLIQ